MFRKAFLTIAAVAFVGSFVMAARPASAALSKNGWTTNGWSNGWVNGWNNGWTNGWMNGWTSNGWQNGVYAGQSAQADGHALRVIGFEFPSAAVAK